LRLGVELICRPRGRLRRFLPGTRFRRVLTTCCACRRGIIVRVARTQDEAVMRRNSTCLTCEGSTVAQKFEDMTPHQFRRPRRRADPIATFMDEVDAADMAWRAGSPTITNEARSRR
jgi:hypothetical protein